MCVLQAVWIAFRLFMQRINMKEPSFYSTLYFHDCGHAVDKQHTSMCTTAQVSEGPGEGYVHDEVQSHYTTANDNKTNIMTRPWDKAAVRDSLPPLRSHYVNQRLSYPKTIVFHPCCYHGPEQVHYKMNFVCMAQNYENFRFSMGQRKLAILLVGRCNTWPINICVCRQCAQVGLNDPALATSVETSTATRRVYFLELVATSLLSVFNIKQQQQQEEEGSRQPRHRPQETTEDSSSDDDDPSADDQEDADGEEAQPHKKDTTQCDQTIISTTALFSGLSCAAECETDRRYAQDVAQALHYMVWLRRHDNPVSSLGALRGVMWCVGTVLQCIHSLRTLLFVEPPADSLLASHFAAVPVVGGLLDLLRAVVAAKKGHRTRSKNGKLTPIQESLLMLTSIIEEIAELAPELDAHRQTAQRKWCEMLCSWPADAKSTHNVLNDIHLQATGDRHPRDKRTVGQHPPDSPVAPAAPKRKRKARQHRPKPPPAQQAARPVNPEREAVAARPRRSATQGLRPDQLDDAPPSVALDEQGFPMDMTRQAQYLSRQEQRKNPRWTVIGAAENSDAQLTEDEEFSDPDA